ncbi:MAG: rhomboid family intramembrane serine protease [Phycisphaerales bacterium]|nr:rhomboid family intramembrane serine protease [Phycisphaerales bacterium]
MFLPIRTETSVRHAPIANVALIGLNVLVFFILDFGMGRAGIEYKNKYFVLDGLEPSLIQFITYQFSHADLWHIGGNMLFLWVFGNAVNAKMGDIAYVLFYLAGGIFAALGFHMANPGLSLLGASGSIAAVTTAYLVLFPRSHVTVLYVFFFIGTFEVPATIIIGAKIIVWDNVVAPQITGGGNVAHSAHLAGYLFGVLAASVMLLIRAIPRDQFDMLALVKRWNQRRAFASAMANPQARAQAQYGRVARAVPADPRKRAEWEQKLDQRTTLRAEIASHLQRGATDEAMAAYDRLVAMDPEQCMSADQQMTLGRAYYANGRFPQAAAAFERYLACYRHNAEANEVRLLLGIINARDLKQYESAERHLKEALEKITNPSRREQAQRWLDEARLGMGGASH